ncbi:hypothetical protein HBI56_217870 [Parastagonospora nodorum]|uniref:Uncharacterized protein n=1 Tax=Phaeosphaeria nodorum (strain SN15 / ATCC MYA-4574 / FGSC 10173) TaxID=321614 RepID=A0A7U2FAN9_PHANO|nr:hypothetical protein HBH56_226180 [Parastagonospora nodorum]QRD01814.1 hypothetical protein JI435_047960 [Parastagonospora nodorum SN15]KAH3935390.1 hypothetical protein HBH54_032540 [Parastagonospora nodorum]KAH3940011.1 hypothetical protein HBH53_224220 [Parastagonospora nodorum]KAH3957625.1 hypothetical protein HBH51_222480 [Parastagonospora nodorum]
MAWDTQGKRSLGSKFAMFAAAPKCAIFGSDESMSWDLENLDDGSFTLDVQQYMPKTPCTATNLYAWSRIVFSLSIHAPQQEHIPLGTIRPKAEAPYSDSESSFCETEATDCGCDAGGHERAHANPEPLVFNIHFEDRTYTKRLDYLTFARWENVKDLLEGFEGESATIKQLWDVREDMPICSGDWDARVHPGMEIDVICWKTDMWEYDSGLSSDDEEDAKGHAQGWEDVHLHGRRWWFGAWKRKVEQEVAKSTSSVRDPSRGEILLGVLAMATFVGMVVLVCTV